MAKISLITELFEFHGALGTRVSMFALNRGKMIQHSVFTACANQKQYPFIYSEEHMLLCLN